MQATPENRPIVIDTPVKPLSERMSITALAAVDWYIEDMLASNVCSDAMLCLQAVDALFPDDQGSLWGDR